MVTLEPFRNPSPPAAAGAPEASLIDLATGLVYFADDGVSDVGNANGFGLGQELAGKMQIAGGGGGGGGRVYPELAGRLQQGSGDLKASVIPAHPPDLIHRIFQVWMI